MVLIGSCLFFCFCFFLAGSCWFLEVLDGCLYFVWFLVFNLLFLLVLCESFWFLVINFFVTLCGSCRPLVLLGRFWWFFMVLGSSEWSCWISVIFANVRNIKNRDFENFQHLVTFFKLNIQVVFVNSMCCHTFWVKFWERQNNTIFKVFWGKYLCVLRVFKWFCVYLIAFCHLGCFAANLILPKLPLSLG